MKFDSLPLVEPLLRSIQAAGYDVATPIQQEAIPQVLKGRDLIGCAQTGTGKTAAFALPTLQQLMASAPAPTGAARRRQRSGRRVIRALILAPTRELAGQIGDSLATYGKFTHLSHAVIFGGIRQGPQVRALQGGVDILVATPGRLLDLIGQGYVDLAQVEILILDEADQMLDMGFIHDLRKIVARVPDRRQTLMFSATMPPAIRELAGQWLRRPFQLEVTPVASTPKRVAQSVYFVERNEKAATLTWYLQANDRSRTLVFSRTKRGADKIARQLQRDGIHALAIHGNKSQARRQAVMREFNSSRPPVLVATDLAARGLDFSNISHVINYDLPDVPATYVHRIGRTARAGASGQAVSFCGRDERPQLRMIEKLTGQAIAVQKPPAASERQRCQQATAEAKPKRLREADAGQQHAAQTDQQQSSAQADRRAARSPRGSSPRSAVGANQRRGAKTSRPRRKERPRVAARL